MQVTEPTPTVKAKLFLDLKTVQPLQREQPHSVEMAVTASARVGEVHVHITAESPGGSKGCAGPVVDTLYDSWGWFKTFFDGRIHEEYCLCRHDNGVFNCSIR